MAFDSPILGYFNCRYCPRIEVLLQLQFDSYAEISFQQKLIEISYAMIIWIDLSASWDEIIGRE